MNRFATLVSMPALVVTLGCALWLAYLEADGPRRVSLQLEGGVPATLYLPDVADIPDPPVPPPSPFRPTELEPPHPDTSPTPSPLPVPPEARAAREPDPGPARPAAVVLAHGFASDQAGMSGLARALAEAGYAVLTPDLQGHGKNRNSFATGRGRGDFLVPDLRAAVDFLRTSREVDGARISVMGHSMGAGAALAYASRDPALDASVMISGGRRIDGPHRPPNALFIYGEGDPLRTRTRAAELAGELTREVGWENAKPGVVYGRVSEGRAVSQVDVARAGHLTILSSQYAARRIIGWLDKVQGVERGTFFLRADPRLRVAFLGMIAFVLALPGLGTVVGRLAPRLAERPGGGAPGRLLALVVALGATLPLVAVGGAGSLVPLVLADVVATHLFATGVGLLAWLVLSGRLVPSSLLVGRAATGGAAALGIVAVYLLLTPFGAVLHGLGLSPERAAAALLLLLLMAPFQLGFHFLLRRGGTFSAAVASLLGRAAVVAVLMLAVSVGMLSQVVLLMLPVLVMLFLLFELLSSAIYATSRNHAVAALVESAWLSWIFAAVLPMT